MQTRMPFCLKLSSPEHLNAQNMVLFTFPVDFSVACVWKIPQKVSLPNLVWRHNKLHYTVEHSPHPSWQPYCFGAKTLFSLSTCSTIKLPRQLHMVKQYILWVIQPERWLVTCFKMFESLPSLWGRLIECQPYWIGLGEACSLLSGGR